MIIRRLLNSLLSVFMICIAAYSSYELVGRASKFRNRSPNYKNVWFLVNVPNAMSASLAVNNNHFNLFPTPRHVLAASVLHGVC